MREMGHAVEFYFQRNGDLLFDFLGGMPWPCLLYTSRCV